MKNRSHIFTFPSRAREAAPEIIIAVKRAARAAATLKNDGLTTTAISLSLLIGTGLSRPVFLLIEEVQTLGPDDEQRYRRNQQHRAENFFQVRTCAREPREGRQHGAQQSGADASGQPRDRAE